MIAMIAEQQKAPEADQVAVDHPGEIGRAEVQRALDRRKGDVDDRGVDDAHQLGEADDDEGDPAGVGRIEAGTN
ncbi:MAG TPA: hypothetical protein VIK04_18160 [Solirubrobacteraceae bacterium]